MAALRKTKKVPGVVVSDRSTVINPPGDTVWVYDPLRDTIDFVSASYSSLYRYDLQQQTFGPALALGGTPNSVAISPDGQYLLIGDKAPHPAGAPQYDVVTRVNLATDAVDHVQASLSFAGDRGVAQVAVDANGMAIFGTPFTSTPEGVSGFFAFQAAASTPAVQPAAPLALFGQPNTRMFAGSYMLSSDDHRYLVFEDQSNSGGEIAVYDSSIGAIIARSAMLYAGASGFQTGRGDVANNGLIADLTHNNLIIFDRQLHVVADLSSYQRYGPLVGATFNDDAHQLFVWNGIEKTVLVFDTQSWFQVGSLSSSIPGYNFTGLSFGAMQVVGHGQMLALNNGRDVELIDLAARLHLTVKGGAAAQALYGGVGADTVTGGPGADTIVGGGGADVLTGGGGADLFVFSPGGSPAAVDQMATITDWRAGDMLTFGGAAGSAANFATATAASFAEALTLANQQMAAGSVDYVAVAVGGDVVVFADSRGDNAAHDAVILAGRGLADLDASAIVRAPRPAPPAAPGIPVAPPMSLGGQVTVAGDMDGAHLSDLLAATITQASDTQFAASGAGGLAVDLKGWGFTYVNDQLVDGTVSAVSFTDVRGGATILQFSAVHRLPAANFQHWLASDATATAFQTILAGNDFITGGPQADVIYGYGGDDVIFGYGGSDTIYGGDGNDIIYADAPPGRGAGAPAGSTYLRGGAGDDYIVGGSGFNYVNGNQGDDTIIGRSSVGDVLLGGQGNDIINASQSTGHNIINGNLGDDTLVAGSGGDTVRGGQGDDVIYGGSGNDWLSGDRGNNTLTGGAGADTFHAGPGNDLVTDFDAAEGDRVMLDLGTAYTVSQVGEDVQIDLVGGGRMILQHVQLSTLPPGWLFEA